MVLEQNATVSRCMAITVPSGILQGPDKAQNTPRLVSLGVKFTFSDHLPQPLKMGVSAAPDYMYVQ